HPPLDGAPEHDLAPVQPFLFVAFVLLGEVERPVAGAAHPVPVGLAHRRRRDLLDLAVDGPTLVDEVADEEVVDPVHVDGEPIAGGQPDALDVAREVEKIPDLRVEEWLLADPIAGEYQPLSPRIPEGEPEHARGLPPQA